MTIIKEGVDKVELLMRQLLGTRTFECKVCCCVFEANRGEYKQVRKSYICICPNCGEEVKE